jgi:hypothetical protein
MSPLQLVIGTTMPTAMIAASMSTKILVVA